MLGTRVGECPLFAASVGGVSRDDLHLEILPKAMPADNGMLVSAWSI